MSDLPRPSEKTPTVDAPADVTTVSDEKKKGRKLILNFSALTFPKLDLVSFQEAEGRLLSAVGRTNFDKDRTFRWTEFAKAFSVFFLHYFAERRSDGHGFYFGGIDMEAPAKVLTGQLYNENKFHKLFPGGLLYVFGSGDNYHGKSLGEIRIRAPGSLPRDCVEIYWKRGISSDEEPLSNKDDINDLADSITVGLRPAISKSTASDSTKDGLRHSDPDPDSGPGDQTRLRDAHEKAGPMKRSFVEKDSQRQIESRNPLPIEMEIKRALKKYGLGRQVYGQWIELFLSPETRGWERQAVSHVVERDYVPPHELKKLMSRFKPSPPNKGNFGLQKCPLRPFADANDPVEFVFNRGSFHHWYALQKAFENRSKDEACRKAREAFERFWLQDSKSNPLSTSRLFHTVCASVILLTSDNKVVLCRRNAHMVAGGQWSVSLEERMMRETSENPNEEDEHLFDCAERGVRTELGVKVIPKATKLLKVGIEWFTFTAVFIFLARCLDDFNGVVKCWLNAEDPYEAAAVDCMPATRQSLEMAFQQEKHLPSKQFVQRDPMAVTEGYWHPTSKARLKALMEHLHYLETRF